MSKSKSWLVGSPYRRVISLGLLFGSIVIVWLYQQESRLILKQKVTSWQEDHSADCAVVLTGGANRVREGFDLLAQKRIKKLILSGVHPKAHLREIFPQWPFYGAIREEDVVLERRSKTTYGNIQQSLPLLEALYCRDVVLVTSRLHMHRALKTFQSFSGGKYLIYPRAVIAKAFNPSSSDIFIETSKSLFYQLFAYR
ncbi:hypothetical protein COB52_03735 [Candidatus Kaiserbacteria bacterium]|nr:MAG: hypothetical protein COB52_03735 [Candidatus Kaiserbacteria bacterium]